ncbi:MAG: hypothetical protein RPR97_18445 [Colwellia sp.]
MNSASLIKKGLFQLLYSVIETGVCRIITSKSPNILVTLKRAYVENIPEYHQVIFLSGKIENLEDLTNALVKSGENQFSTVENHEEFIEQAKLYLIANKGKGITTIWALENADLVSSDMHQLLAQLLLWQCFGRSLLAIELWGHSLLLSSYNSGEISQYYQSKIYPISLNENLKLKSTSIHFKLAITLVVGLFLGHQIKPLLEKFSNSYDTSEQQSINLISNIKINKREPKSAVVKPAFDGVANKNSQPEILNQSNVLVLNDNAVFEKNAQIVPIALTSSTDKINNKEMHNEQIVEHILQPKDPHWYFNLLPSKWLNEYNINLTHQLQTKNNQYYIQYGVYRHKKSIINFITRNSLLSDYYHLCYSSDWQMVALMTGAYQGYRQAFKNLSKIKEQGFDGTIVNSDYLNTWQCSNVVR